MAARILIIEDNVANLELMRYLLHTFGHSVLVAHDGEAGINLAALERPDLVLCDVQLPGLDGYAVTRALKGDPDLRTIPVVAVTAFAMVGDRDKILAGGFDAYLPKPIVPESFVSQVEEHLDPQLYSARLPRAAMSNLDNIPLPPMYQGVIIVLVDSTVGNLSVARSTLEPKGYQLTVLGSLEAALEHVRHQHADLLLVDLHLSEADTHRFIGAMRRDVRLRSIPVLIITSELRNGLRDTISKDATAIGILLRPYAPQALLDAMDALLAGRTAE